MARVRPLPSNPELLSSVRLMDLNRDGVITRAEVRRTAAQGLPTRPDLQRVGLEATTELMLRNIGAEPGAQRITVASSIARIQSASRLGWDDKGSSGERALIAHLN